MQVLFNWTEWYSSLSVFYFPNLGKNWMVAATRLWRPRRRGQNRQRHTVYSVSASRI